MRILLDVDSCIYDFLSSFDDYIESVCNPYNAKLRQTPYTWNMWDYMEITKDQWSAYMHDFVNSHGFRNGNLCEPEIPQIIKNLKSRNHEIIICTARHVPVNGLKAQVISDTIWWLKENDIYYDNICFITDKSLVDGDILLDDAEHHLRDFSQDRNGRISIAYDTPYNQNWDGNRVKSWKEFEKLVISYG